MIRKIFVLILVYTSSVRSDLWDGLKVKWGPDPSNPSYFVSLPQCETSATEKGWKLQKDCSQINGRRYTKDNDTGVLLVYGANNLLAGISIAVPKNLPLNFPSSELQPYFVDEGGYYTFTAYFVDPSRVCTTTYRQPGGDRVVIKGQKKEMNIPLTQAEADKQAVWTKGKCFPSMGVHYWNDVSGTQVSKSTTSDSFFPMFLLYNNGRLNGFGWALNANLTSPMLEHPTSDVVGIFMQTVPDFIYDPTKSGVLSTLHIFIDDTPHLNNC